MKMFSKCKRNYFELKENDPIRMKNPDKFKDHEWWCIIQIRDLEGCDCK